MTKPKGKAQEVYELAKVLEELKAGDNVKFADGHQLAGTLALVNQINPDGTITVRVGKAVQPPVPASMLIKLDMGQPAAAAQAAPTTPAAAPTA